MARRETALTKDTSQTAGTGTYTLDNASAAGYQTLAQAVSRGLASNGDEVIYRVSDPGDPVVYEVGRGTIGSAGLTVTRAEILERDDGSTSPKSWPSGGARNFVVTFWPPELVRAANNGSEFTAATFAANLGLARLIANTFTDGQSITKSTAAGIFQALTRGNSATASTSNIVRDVWTLKDDGGSVRNALTLDVTFSNVGAGTRTTRATFSAQNAGASSAIFKVEDGVLKDGSGNKYVAFPTGGTVGIVFTTAPAVGFTRQNRTGERVPRFAGAADTPGAEGGSWTVSGLSASAEALSIAQMPAHTHQVVNGLATGFTSFAGGSSTAFVPISSANNAGVNTTGSAGSGSTHTHTISSSGAWRPAYRIVCEATHD